MPAIQLAELKKESAKITANFSEGEVVIKELKEFFEHYSNRTHRVNPSAERVKVIPSYKITQPILKQLITDLNKKAPEDPLSAIKLTDLLWQQNNLEFRILAAHLIGAIPAEHSRIVIARLHNWGRENTEESIGKILSSNSLTRLIQDAKPKFIQLVDDWLKADHLEEKILGLEALLGYIKTAKFEEIPVVFRLLKPLSLEANRKLHPYILNVIRLLAQRSPQETLFFLRQGLEPQPSPTTAWLIRKSLPLFPQKDQAALKTAIRPKLD